MGTRAYLSPEQARGEEGLRRLASIWERSPASRHVAAGTATAAAGDRTRHTRIEVQIEDSLLRERLLADLSGFPCILEDVGMNAGHGATQCLGECGRGTLRRPHGAGRCTQNV